MHIKQYVYYKDTQVKRYRKNILITCPKHRRMGWEIQIKRNKYIKKNRKRPLPKTVMMMGHQVE